MSDQPFHFRPVIVPVGGVLAYARGGHMSAREAREWLNGGSGGMIAIGGPRLIDELLALLHDLSVSDINPS